MAAAPLKAVQAFRTLLQSLQAAAQELTVAELVERVLERSGYLDALEAERTIEAQGRIENLQELVGVAQEYQAAAERAEPVELPPGDLALLRPGRDPRRAEPRHADDAPQREGPRVPGRLHDRDGGGDLPALALASRSKARGGAAARVRRHDARAGAADADARDRRARSRAAASTTCRRASSTSCPTEGVERERLRPTSWSGYGAPAGVAPRDDVPTSRPATPSATDRSARASSPRSSAGGVVTVRFAYDGSERRLMLEYAPLEKIA